MVFSDLTFEEMIEKIKFTKWTTYDYIRPADHPDCPSMCEWQSPKKYDIIPENREHNSDLWAQFVTEIYDRPHEIIEAVNTKENKMGPQKKGAAFISLALENAFYNGNQNNPDLAVSLKVFEGEKGIVIRIRDSGAGFDYKTIMKKVDRLYRQSPLIIPEKVSEEDKYFKRKGKGFDMFRAHPAEFAFENKGTTINIMLKYEQ